MLTHADFVQTRILEGVSNPLRCAKGPRSIRQRYSESCSNKVVETSGSRDAWLLQGQVSQQSDLNIVWVSRIPS